MLSIFQSICLPFACYCLCAPTNASRHSLECFYDTYQMAFPKSSYQTRHINGHQAIGTFSYLKLRPISSTIFQWLESFCRSLARFAFFASFFCHSLTLNATYYTAAALLLPIKQINASLAPCFVIGKTSVFLGSIQKENE